MNFRLLVYRCGILAFLFLFKAASASAFGLRTSCGACLLSKMDNSFSNGSSGLRNDTAKVTEGMSFYWKAKWIGLDSSFAWDRPQDAHSKLSARYFRKEFDLHTAIKKATLYFTGLGLYKLYINGKKIGAQQLSPTPSDYRKRVYYNVFDVSNAFLKGENTVGVVLGNGLFFSMRPGKAGEWKLGIPTIVNFGYPKMIFQLEIEYKDGKKQMIISDNTWKVTADGPIRSDNEYDGEVQDFSKEMPGWNSNGFDASRWLDVDLTTPPGGMLKRQENPNMKVMDIVHPISIRKTLKGSFIVDLGQNMAGWINLKTTTTPNTSIVLRYAERLDSGGHLYTANLRSAQAKDSIFTGSKRYISWHPSFVYHGFRYVEISGLSSLEKNEIEGQEVYDDMKTIGSFSCSDSILNKIYKAAYWTIRDNYKGMPTDCPQRDERMGWLGDRSVNCYGESFLFDNHLLYAKWLDDIADAQLKNGSIPDIAPGFWPGFLTDNSTWPSTYIFVANMLYRQFGDENVIRKHYPNMKRWMAHMLTYLNSDSLVQRDEFGDWCMPPESKVLIHSTDSTRITPGGFIGAAYYIHCLQVMSQFAAVLGMAKDSMADSFLRNRMINAINKKYFHVDKGFYANNTVTANLLALSFDIVPPARRKDVAANIAKVSKGKFDNHVSTGLIGSQWLMRGLTHNDDAGIAYTIATNTTYPSFGYMLSHGATTIWELWNGNTADPAMNSENHVMLLGDLLIWYYEDLAGIKSSTPGFKKITMKPVIQVPLSFVKAKYNSPNGEISSSWNKERDHFHWDITIPQNCTATVYVPAKTKSSIHISGKSKFVKASNGYFEYQVSNGHYQVSSIFQ